MRCNSKKSIRLAVFLFMLGTVVGCAVHEPRPVPLENMDAVQPKQVIQAQKPDPKPISRQPTPMQKLQIAPIWEDLWNLRII